MIGGIFETIGKTLGVGKEKYFLELDDAAEDTVKGIKQAAAKATEVAKDVASDVADKAQDLASDATEDGKAKAKAAVNKVQDAAEQASESATAAGEAAKQNVQDVAKTTAKKADKATKKAKKSANDAKAAAEKVEQAAEPAQTATALPPAPDPNEIIVNAIAEGSRKRNGNAVGPNGEALNFSTDYLMPKKKMRRRRPGPSFNDYKGMAKEVNPRLR